MKRLLPLLLLSGCALFGPDPEGWEPSGHITDSGWFSLIDSRNPMGPVFPTGQVTLYRANPAERPTMHAVEVAEGQTVEVEVWRNKCLLQDLNAHSVTAPVRAIYLCRMSNLLEHEIAHQKGMRHSEWLSTGVAHCATVLDAGYRTKYRVGDEICIRHGREMERASK